VSELNALRNKSKWFEVLLRTTGASLTAKTPDLAYRQAEALENLDLNRLVPALNEGSLTVEQRRNVARCRSS
jgi:hypothetical protein